MLICWLLPPSPMNCLFKQWCQLICKPPFSYFHLHLSLQNLFVLQSARGFKKLQSCLCWYVKLPFLTMRGERNNRKRTYTRKGKTEKIFQFHKIAAKGKKKWWQPCLNFIVSNLILYYRLHNMCVTCLGFDLLSDLWLWIPAYFADIGYGTCIQ